MPRFTQAPIRRAFLKASFAALAATAAMPAAFAQGAPGYPSKPITMVVPFPAGGPTDLIARVLAQELSKQMGQSVMVDNRGGANGNIGAAAVAKASADGYTILFNTSSITLSPALYKSVPYDLLKDFTPVSQVSTVPLALVLNPSVPANNVKEFIAYVKANQGKLAYGSAGAGNATHLGAFQFLQAFGLDATHVPYKGSAPADVDLVGGQIQFMTDTVSTVIPFVRDKRMKLLAVTSAKRMSIFPEVPTLAESGMPGFEAGAWQGVLVPTGTPQPVIARLHSEFVKALAQPEVRKKLSQQGAEPVGSSPEEYGAYIRKELTRWAGVVKATGVSLD